LLVGPVNSGKDQLDAYSNIIMVGAKPYEALPSYLSNIDVCLIPFKLNDITLASNPIKMYEYLAAGKPVVSTALPEVVRNASEIVYIGKNDEDFLRKVENAVKESQINNEGSINERVSFAKKNSWQSRIQVMEENLNEVVGL
jgi:glycosyltransferase involved in cell wall biosynthesis